MKSLLPEASLDDGNLLSGVIDGTEADGVSISRCLWQGCLCSNFNFTTLYCDYDYDYDYQYDLIVPIDDNVAKILG